MAPIDRARTPEARDLVHYANETSKKSESQGEPTYATYPTLFHVVSGNRSDARVKIRLRTFAG